MTAYNAKHPYEPDWQIPRGVWANEQYGNVYSRGFIDNNSQFIVKGSIKKKRDIHA